MTDKTDLLDQREKLLKELTKAKAKERADHETVEKLKLQIADLEREIAK